MKPVRNLSINGLADLEGPYVRWDLPLFRWGEELRSRTTLRQYRKNVAAAAALSCVALLVGLAWHPSLTLIWNVSASAPPGLYLLSSPSIRIGDMVAARLPPPFGAFAATRRYLPAGVPLIKKVVAGPGDIVCAAGRSIRIDGRPVALRLSADSAGRPLPTWSGCKRLRYDQLFLLMAGNPRSFDGRYFGISRRSDILGQVTLIWRD